MTRKPKFASLRDRLAPALPPQPQPQPPGMVKNQPELFQVQPDSDPQVACLLEQDDAVDASATISALFGPASSSSAVFDEAPSPVSSSMDWDGEGLARRALRGRERWVFCRSSSAEEAVSSGGRRIDLWGGAPSQGLSLKLDYEEILTAWSDKGSLYINGEGPQVVPELQQICVDDCTAPSMFIEVGSNGSNWRVPEMDIDQEDGDQRRNMDKSSSRKERVMRYKEKRQSRLFAKRIRYEVRKLNAEKRPRIKGRFVKRNDDM